MADNIHLDLRYKLLAGLLFNTAANLADAGQDKLSKQVLLGPSYRTGLDRGRQYGSDFEVTGRNAVSSSAPLIIAAETYGASYEIPSSDAHDLRMDVTSCPFREQAARFGPQAERKCCDTCGEYFRGLVHGLNPEAAFDMPQRMGYGDERCRVRVRVDLDQPGPDEMVVPADVKSLSLMERRLMMIESLSDMLRGVKHELQAALGPEDVERLFGFAAHPVGLRDGATMREQRAIHGRSLGPAADVLRRIHEILGVEYRLLEATPQQIKWSLQSCPFEKLMPADYQGPQADAVCRACKNYQEGVLDATADRHFVDIIKRLPQGDKNCEFEATWLPRGRWVNRAGRGRLDYDSTRVALLGSQSTYQHLWRILGPNLEAVGRRVARDIGGRALRLGRARRDNDGFQLLLAELEAMGLGRFDLLASDLGLGTATVRLHDAFEVHAAAAAEAQGPTCFLAAGLIGGLLELVCGFDDVGVKEVECAADGLAACLFELRRMGS